MQCIPGAVCFSRTTLACRNTPECLAHCDAATSYKEVTGVSGTLDVLLLSKTEGAWMTCETKLRSAAGNKSDENGSLCIYIYMYTYMYTYVYTYVYICL